MTKSKIFEMEPCYSKAGSLLYQRVYMNGTDQLDTLERLRSVPLPSPSPLLKVSLGAGKREKKLPVGDLFYFTHQQLVVSPRAKEILARYLGGMGTFVPLEEADGREIWLFQVQKYLEVLDSENCIIERAPAGYITEVKKLCFKRDAIDHLYLFRSAEIHPGGPCFLTHNFINLMKEHQLEGICPKLIWEE